jgi:hypothetical protein
MKTKKKAQEIYVICDDSGWIKVGISNNTVARLKNLQTSNRMHLRLVGAFPLNSDRSHHVERASHNALEHCERRGEWFKASCEEAVAVVRHAIDNHNANKIDVLTSLMTTKQYKTVIEQLGFSHVGAGSVVGISRRQAQRLYAGRSPIPDPVAKLLRYMLKYGVDVPPLPPSII